MSERMVRALAIAAVMAGSAGAEMAIQLDPATQRYAVSEDGKPVLTYNFGTNPVPPGVGGIYAVARGDYVHPLFGPSGEVLTTDFSKDHPHHRGLYWAWPVVTYGGVTGDLHALQGVFARPVRILAQKADAQSAELSAENVWLWRNEEPIVRESATITAHCATGGLRAIDFHFRFDALKPGVTLARRHGDAYGGFNLRFSPRRDQRIAKDAPAWAELAGVLPEGKEPIGVLILQAPTNPDFPGDWIDYPNLNWLQPTFPAKGTSWDLSPGAPLDLRYRIVVRSGPGLAVDPASLAAAYAASLPDPLDALLRYDGTTSRAGLAAIEERLRTPAAVDQRAVEQRLLRLLARPEASGEFKRWACKQLAVAGSDAAVPAAAALLKDDTAWMQAADVLYARPGDAGLAALREAIPSLPADRQVALLNLLAMRRDAKAVPLLTSLCTVSDTRVAAAALAALGDLGTPEAARALVVPPPNPAMRSAWGDACLRSASPDLLGKVLADASLPTWQQAGALQALAAAAPSVAWPLVAQGLTNADAHLRNGAIAGLRAMPEEALAGFRAAWTGSTEAVRLALVAAWGERGIRSAEPELLAALTSQDSALSLGAVRALRSAGSAAAVAPLLALAAAPDGRGKEAQATLAQMRGDGLGGALRRGLRDANGAVAVAALRALGERHEAGVGDDLFAALSDPRREIARAAVSLLRTDGDAELLPRLRPLLVDTADDATRREIAQVLVAICRRQPDAQGALAAVLAAERAQAGPAREAMLAALPAMGGDAALAYVARSADEAAIRALLKWPDDSALAPLLDIAKKQPVDAPLRALAAAGYVQLAERVLPPSRIAACLAPIVPYVPDATQRQALAERVKGVDLALQAAVTSSRPSEGGHPPEHAVDGVRTTGSYLGCTPPPAALTVDLGVIQRVGCVRVWPYWGDGRYYQYIVEASCDGTRWATVADMRTNTTPGTAEGFMHRFTSTDARYLRTTMQSNSVNPGLHIVEFEAYAPTGAGGEGTP